MDKRVAVVVLLLVAGGLFAYTFLMGGGPEQDDKAVRASFDALKASIISGNPDAVSSMVAPGFTDPGINRENLIRVLTIKRRAYDAVINSVNIQGDLASLSYTRTDARGEGEAVTSRVIGETWMRDAQKPGRWLLRGLAKDDAGFRSLAIPTAPAPAKEAKKEGATVLGTIETQQPAQVAAMKEGERYASAGKRDPFMPLIAGIMGEGAASYVEECDPERPRETLEEFDLLSLKLSGVIVTDKESLALVSTPDGKGHTVRKDMYLGKSCGKVIAIEPEYVVIREQRRKPGTIPAKFDLFETIMKLRPEEG